MPVLSPRVIASTNLAFACSIAYLTAATSTTGGAAVAAESFTGVSPFGAHASGEQGDGSAQRGDDTHRTAPPCE